MKKTAILFAAVFTFIVVQTVWAQEAPLLIQSTGAADPRIPIAVPPFAVADPSLKDTATELANVIAFDLDFSGIFKIVSEAEYPAEFSGLPLDVAQLNLDLWRKTRAEYIVYGTLTNEGGILVGRLRLFDLMSKEQLVGQELKVDPTYPRLLGHHFSEEVIRNIDGVAGIGTTEIVYSSGEPGKKEIYIADYDGANARRVTEHGSVSIKPKFSPDGRYIAYSSYKDRYAHLFVFDRKTGTSRSLSKEVGLNSSPAWSPDGTKLAMTLSKDGNTEIYTRNADGSGLQRLTDNKEGDTSPCYSPDGTQICFVSDRGGSPQIYVMSSNGGGQQRISVQGGSCYDPTWSPDGKKIAYVVEKKGDGLEIYTMNADGTGAERVTESQGSNESPSWSPDSRHVVFMSTRSGRAELYTYTPQTKQTRVMGRLTLRAEGPSWGPRRQ